MIDKGIISKWLDDNLWHLKVMMGCPEYEVRIEVVPETDLELNQDKTVAEMKRGLCVGECSIDSDYRRVEISISQDTSYYCALRTIIHELAHVIGRDFKDALLSLANCLDDAQKETVINTINLKKLDENLAVKIENLVDCCLNIHRDDTYRDLYRLSDYDDPAPAHEEESNE